MSQVDAQISDVTADQGDAQGAGQVADQQSQTVVDGGQQRQSVDTSGGAVSVLRRNYAHLAPDGDFNKVISMAKQYRDLEKGGHVALATMAKEADMDGFQLASYFRSQGAGGQQAQQAAVETQEVQQQAQDGVQQGYLTPKQAEDLVAKKLAEFQTEFEAKKTKAEKQAEFDRLMEAEKKARVSQLEQLGYTAKPTKVNLFGTDHELDPVHQFIFTPALESMTQFMIDQELNPNDPDYESNRMQPASEEQVAAAGKALKPYLSLLGQQALEAAADQQETLPEASLTAGPGGRAQSTAQPKTWDEAKSRVLGNAKVRAKLGGR